MTDRINGVNIIPHTAVEDLPLLLNRTEQANGGLFRTTSLAGETLPCISAEPLHTFMERTYICNRCLSSHNAAVLR